MHKIAPSILSADFANMGRDIEKLEAWGASLVHCDVMDGVFVDNITFGPQMISAIRPYTALPLDVHLMIAEPERHIKRFADAGADIITIHQEATAHLHRALKMIADCGVKAGVALNPATCIATVEHVLDMIDLVLIMTVNPGHGGQQMIPSMLDKIASMKKALTEGGAHCIEIEIDGGVYAGNAAALVSAGADILVAGSAIFAADDPANAVKELSLALERTPTESR